MLGSRTLLASVQHQAVVSQSPCAKTISVLPDDDSDMSSAISDTDHKSLLPTLRGRSP